MPDDLSSVAREAAEAEAHDRISTHMKTATSTQSSGYLRGFRAGFTEGFSECASRIPSETELAAEMKRHHFADNLLGNITWDMWMSQCECGWESSEFRYPGESSDAYYAHAAGAVLALVGERLQAK